jgi:hypothetical protein
MTSAARSIYVFGIYLIATGGFLMGAPNTFLSIFGIQPTTEPWIRIVGMLVIVIGILDLACARNEQTAFFRATVYTRTFAFITFVIFAVLGIAPSILILFGIIDELGALWTFTALKKSASPAIA